MLTRLSIRNIVLIEALDLDFARGLGVLTGETGAGKSILLDALGLILGDRAETSLGRAGEDKASVSVSFEFAALPAGIAAALDDAEIAIEPGEPLIIRRQIKADGGSKAFINDQPASVALLRELAPALVELHGQHDDRGLVNPRGHRLLLDRYAGTDVAGLERAFASWARAEAQLAEPLSDEIDDPGIGRELGQLALHGGRRRPGRERLLRRASAEVSDRALRRLHKVQCVEQRDPARIAANAGRSLHQMDTLRAYELIPPERG
jgi:energy-coupling factor transporter ATP-binding protein EcfA2